MYTRHTRGNSTLKLRVSLSYLNTLSDEREGPSSNVCRAKINELVTRINTSKSAYTHSKVTHYTLHSGHAYAGLSSSIKENR